ncbi:MAG TPA: radical SAM protein [Spirochaetota bacterium]|nr:radical SAM protein [Spirochaetota bacterium]
MRHVFGPVTSRRLGRSLGIDIVPYKLCSLNCVYCECGSTTALTTAVREYAPAADVCAEIDLALAGSPELDVITFSGSGEPTLNSSIGTVINHIKSRYPQYKVAVLTNSTLMNIDRVRRNILAADMIFPSLDAVSGKVFNAIMKPAAGVKPGDIIKGLVKLRAEYKGRICLEIFIVPGFNDTADELELLREAALRIKPDEVHLNRLDRPGSESWVQPVSDERMQEISEHFKPMAVKVIGRKPGDVHVPCTGSDLRDRVLSAVRDGIGDAEDIAGRLGVRVVDVMRICDRLAGEGRACKITGEKGNLYRPV